jgi:hypothetical protein
VAKAEENLNINSENIGVLDLVAGTATNNISTAPNGETTADRITANAGTSLIPRIGINVSTVAGTARTFSIYAKKSTHDFVQVYFANQSADFANFDISSGVVGTTGASTTASIVNIGSGWYRLIVTWTPLGTDRYPICMLSNSASATRAQSWNPVGTEAVDFWGAQTEQRSSVTAYTATTTAPITNYIPALQTAASGVARFEHNPVTGESLGLEIEEQRTNLVLRSDDFANASWTKTNSSIDSNTIVAPDGTLTGDKYIVANGIASNSATVRTDVSKVASAITYTLSAYAKSGEANSLRLFPRDAATVANSASAYFDLSTGIVSGTPTVSGTFTSPSATIASVGNGWYRCSITFTTSTETGLRSQLLIYNNGTSTITGNDWSGIYIWGAQLEAGSFATSYIPTVASQVTRSQDSATMTGTNFSSWYRADEGTLYGVADIPQPALSGGQVRAIATLSDGTTSNYITIGRATVATSIRFRFVSNGVEQNGTNGQTATVSSSPLLLASYSYRVNDLAFSGNAGTVVTDTNGAIIPVVNQLFIGESPFSTTQSRSVSGTIKKIAYYPLRLTNSEIQSLTTI